jgi:hypothetical protein
MTEEAWELFAVMKDEKCVRVVAKKPDRPVAVDVTLDLIELVARAIRPPDRSE